MSWFNEQIKQRKDYNTDIFSESMYDIIGAVTGEKTFFRGGNAKNEIDRVLEYYNIKSRDLPASIKDLDAQIEYLIRPNGIMKRRVKLEKGWYKDAMYPMLTALKDGTVTALIPGKNSGYFYTDRHSGRVKKVSAETEDLFEDTAFCFYKPFPLEKLTEKEIVKNICRLIKKENIVFFAAVTLLSLLISMLIPSIYKLIFSHIVYQKNIQPLITVAVMLMCITFAVSLMTAVKKMITGRIKNNLNVSVETAVMMRILSLPSEFFKAYSSGELTSKIMSVSELCTAISENLVSVGITSVFSIVYFVWIMIYTPQMILPTVTVFTIMAVFLVKLLSVRTKTKKKIKEITAEEQGIGYSLISAVSKIKLVGAEMRAFAKWGKKYAERARAAYDLPLILKLEKSIIAFITIMGSVWIYYTAAGNNLSATEFYAFTAAYSVIMGAAASFSDSINKISDIKPAIENIKIFFDTVPEISANKQVITHLAGGIELNNVTFGYNENKKIIDNMSLKIRSGEYVAVVGKTGCGKSTLIRLLLGFETPQKGAVYYDGKDISTLDLKSLRQKIGIVLQNGKLFSGDIFSNIAISAPHITLEDAWDAAEKAGIAEDIRNMPMGMNTIISDGGGGISGGQRQRILIARAIAAKPRIIIFDEATSALDNVTQKIVSETLDNIKCTKIIVAHRLSTIEKCSRIIVLDNGKIAEDGTYEELLDKGGLFAQLVSRQKVM